MMIVYADGACHMGIGASVQTADGGEIDTVSAFLGDGTNNMAEYQPLG
jgi:hypothetical protein